MIIDVPIFSDTPPEPIDIWDDYELDEEIFPQIVFGRYKINVQKILNLMRKFSVLENIIHHQLEPIQIWENDLPLLNGE